MKTILFALFFAFVLSACGGGGSNEKSSEAPPVDGTPPSVPIPEPDAQLAGIYKGNIKGDNYANGWGVYGTILIITEKGTLYVKGVYNYIKATIDLGMHKQEGKVLSFEGHVCNQCQKTPVEDHEYYQQGGIISFISKDNELEGQIELENYKLNSQLSFNRIDDSEKPSSIEVVNGNYTANYGLESMSIDVDGKVLGSDTDGCIYEGTINTDNSELNLYSVSIEYFNCSINGVYSGAGTFLKGTGSDERLFLDIYITKNDQALIHKKFFKD
jgi:hypothetical protein